MTDGTQTSWRRRFAEARDAEYWAANTRILLRDARSFSGEQLQQRLKHFVFWADYSSRHPDSTDSELLAAFAEDFSRLVGNYGVLGDVDIMAALDHAIELRRRNGDSTTRLHLAKARYLATLSLDDDRRLRALQAAVNGSAYGTELWAEAILAYTWYYIDVSRYGKALSMVKSLEAGLLGSPVERKYRCGALTMTGIALFTSFRSLHRAEQGLRQACEYQNTLGDDLDVRRWIASAYHYRGRIAEVEKKYKTALSLYLQGQNVQLQCPEELQALAFIHVRISEPLISAGLFQAARDHLNIALEQFQLAADRSSGRHQVQLGFAALSAAQDQLNDALETVEASRDQARDVGYWRGELLCLGYLLALHARRRDFLQVAGVLIQMLGTIRYGELRRNNVLMLLAKVPVMLRVAARRMSHMVDRDIANEEWLTMCFCPIHVVDA